MTADETSWQAWLHCITGVSVRLIASLCSDNHATWQVKEPSAIWGRRVVSSFPAGLDQHVRQLRVQCRGLLMVRSVHPWGGNEIKNKKIKKGAWSWQVFFFYSMTPIYDFWSSLFPNIKAATYSQFFFKHACYVKQGSVCNKNAFWCLLLL